MANRSIHWIVLSLVLMLGLGLALAQVPMTGAGKGAPAVAPGGYTGPIDIIGSPTNCYSTRACSSALRGTAALNACNALDATCADVSTDATTGLLSASIVIGGTDCSVSTCTVKILYDQGGTSCSGSPCNVENATIALRPTLTANCVNTSLWCISFNGSTQGLERLTNPGTALPQPYSAAFAAKRTGNTSAYNTMVGSSSTANAQFGWPDSSGSGFIYANGGLPTWSIPAEPAFIGMQALFNGASSKYNYAGSGSSNTGSISTGATGSTSGFIALGFEGSSSANYCQCAFLEALLWSGDTSASFAALATNQATFWNY